MEAQSEITKLIHGLYDEIGGSPEEITQIIPKDGRWGTALSYVISRADGKSIRVYRRDIDDNEREKIKGMLRGLL